MATLEQIASELALFQMNSLEDTYGIRDSAKELGYVSSNSEWVRLIKQGAVSIALDEVKIKVDKPTPLYDALQDKENTEVLSYIVKIGKHRIFKAVINNGRHNKAS